MQGVKTGGKQRGAGELSSAKSSSGEGALRKSTSACTTPLRCSLHTAQATLHSRHPPRAWVLHGEAAPCACQPPASSWSPLKRRPRCLSLPANNETHAACTYLRTARKWKRHKHVRRWMHVRLRMSGKCCGRGELLRLKEIFRAPYTRSANDAFFSCQALSPESAQYIHGSNRSLTNPPIHSSEVILCINLFPVATPLSHHRMSLGSGCE